MGTWDQGILDNDCASDGLGDVTHGVLADITRLGASKPTMTTTARLGAAVGVLLQLSAYSFTDTTGAAIVAALQAHAGTIARFPPAFRRVLQKVLAGEGEALAQRPGGLTLRPARLLHTAAKKSPFGKREPALFADKAAAAYVQVVTRRCVEMVDDDFADESNWSDLCREGLGIGGLAALLVLEPSRVPVRKISGWRKKAQRGLATLEADADEELDFQRKYHANLDRVFELLLARFSET